MASVFLLSGYGILCSIIRTLRGGAGNFWFCGRRGVKVRFLGHVRRYNDGEARAKSARERMMWTMGKEYGYFGNGLSGYQQYMAAFKRSFEEICASDGFDAGEEDGPEEFGVCEQADLDGYTPVSYTHLQQAEGRGMRRPSRTGRRPDRGKDHQMGLFFGLGADRGVVCIRAVSVGAFAGHVPRARGRGHPRGRHAVFDQRAVGRCV